MAVNDDSGQERPSVRFAGVDVDTGTFLVSTVTGLYVIDLDGQRMLRAPREVTSKGWTLQWQFDLDGSWLPLVDLEQCTVGEPMRARIRHAGSPNVEPLRSSVVQTIQHASPPSTPEGGPAANC